MTPQTRNVVYLLIGMAGSIAAMMTVSTLLRGVVHEYPALIIATAAAMFVYVALSRWLRGGAPKD